MFSLRGGLQGFEALFSCGRRSLTSQLTEKEDREDLLVINGGSAPIARVMMATASPKVPIIVLSRRQINYDDPNIVSVSVDPEAQKNPECVRKAIQHGLDKLGRSRIHRRILGVNCVGAAVAPRGETLKTVNYDKPFAFARAIGSFEGFEERSLANISSIAAIIHGDSEGCEYANIKQRLNRDLIEEMSHLKHCMSFCPGLVYSKNKDGLLHKDHPYSPIQFAGAGMIPVVGSGNQPQNPVSSEEMVEAVWNGFNQEEPVRRIIPAVGSESVTQIEMLLQFNNRPTVYICHIPLDIASKLSTKFHHGRFAPYAVNMMGRLDREEVSIDGEFFKKLLGRNPLSYSDYFKQYAEIQAKHKPPFGEHLLEVGRRLLEDPSGSFSVITDSIRELRGMRISKYKRES